MRATRVFHNEFGNKVVFDVECREGNMVRLSIRNMEGETTVNLTLNEYQTLLYEMTRFQKTLEGKSDG